MATPKAVSFIAEVAAFANWAGISHPVAHFDLEPRSDTLAQLAYLDMLPVLVNAAAHPSPPVDAPGLRQHKGGASVHLHFDTQHRMGGITLPCPLLAGANVSMARCVLEVRARSRFVASQLLLVKQCLHFCLTLEHGLDQMLAVERVRRATSL